jgi:hemoglobin
VERLAAYWAEALGGPPVYSQSCGDQSTLIRLHSGNGDVTDLERRFVECFVQAAGDAGLPDDREFRAALRAYMQWAVVEINAHPEKDAVIPAGLAMPHWSWDGLQTPVSVRRSPRSHPSTISGRSTVSRSGRPPGGSATPRS